MISDVYRTDLLQADLSADLKTDPAADLSVETSSNVFSENLHSTRGLETTYYVTDSTQAADFYWDRESGLRVNIGILDVHVMPEYEDVDHSGRDDNRYMMSHPHDSDDKIKFQNVIEHYCRYCIQHYCLEIIRFLR